MGNPRNLHRRSFVSLTLIALVVAGVVLTPLRCVGAQVGVTSVDSTPWRAWAFARLGGASSAPGAVATSGGGVLTTASGGVAISRGIVVGIVRATEAAQIFVGPGVRDHAVLIGGRSRAERLFVTGAVGVARATAFQTSDGSGTFTGPRQTAFAYDFSAHANARVAGLALAVSGVVGAEQTSYVAVSLGAEFGWFGR